MSRNDDRLALAHKISLQRSIRLTEWPHEMFDEHAWVMLLTAYQRQSAGETYTAADLATMSGTTVENGSRWLKWLQQDGFVERMADLSVNSSLQLTADAVARMDRYLDAALEVFQPKPSNNAAGA